MITQTLDPLLAAYFRDVAHKKSMLQLIHDRDEIQQQARDELRKKFLQFDIEQVETFQKRQEAAVREKALNEAAAQAQLQAELTKSRVQIKISENTGDAELAKARKQAETTVVQAEAAAKQARLQGEGEAARLLVVAEAQAKQSALIGEGEGKKAALMGEGEGKRVLAVGNAEAAVLQLKIESYRAPRLYAIAIVADHLRQSQQPLVPSQLGVEVKPSNKD